MATGSHLGLNNKEKERK